jgi:hypothetical protein
MAVDNISMLSDLEKQVITKLAESGPMCGYDFHLGGRRERGNRKAIMSSGSWNKIRLRLGSQGEKLIDNIRIKGESSHDERGRRKELVWLTPNGVGSAIGLEVDIKVLLQNVKKVYPENNELQLTLEVAKMVGKDIVKTSYLLNTDQFGKINTALLSSIISPSSDKKEGEKRLRRMMLLFKKYPQFKNFKKELQNRRQQTNRLFDDLERIYSETEKEGT